MFNRREIILHEQADGSYGQEAPRHGGYRDFGAALMVFAVLMPAALVMLGL